MNSVSSATGSPGADAASAYQRNAQRYGPVVASVIGAGDALGQLAETTYTAGSDAVKSTVDGGMAAYEAVAAAAKSAARSVEQGWDAVGQALGSAVDAVEDACESAGEALGEAASAVGDAVGATADAVGEAIGDAIVYGTLGAVSSQALGELD